MGFRDYQKYKRAYKSFSTCTPWFLVALAFRILFWHYHFYPCGCLVYHLLYHFCIDLHQIPWGFIEICFFSILKKPCALRDYWVLCIFIEKMKRGKFATIPSFIFIFSFNLYEFQGRGVGRARAPLTASKFII